MVSTFVVAPGVIFSWFCSSGHSSSSSIDKEPTAYPDFGRREVVPRSFAVLAMAAMFNLRNYNPDNGRRKKAVIREEAMEELLQVLVSERPDRFTPRVIVKKDDYVRVEYESPIFGFVDDLEFWFPPGKKISCRIPLCFSRRQLRFRC